MSVSYVELESDAYLVCLTHALSTEREEVMGLLIGEVNEEAVVRISAVMMLRRSDKRPDRVEISLEQLTVAPEKAKMLSKLLGRPVGVIGWYHSHPHITVCPSSVDIQTQANYQMMDKSFVGLIFSVFNDDKNTMHNKIQMTCFQTISLQGFGGTVEHKKIEVPVMVVPKTSISKACLEALADLPAILQQEEEEAYEKAAAAVSREDLISLVHNSAVFSKSLCNVMEVLTAPLMNMLENELKINEVRFQHLQKQKEELLERIQELDEEERICVAS